METLADLQRRIVELGSRGNKDDPCLTLFIEQYGKCGEIYPEDEWLRMCGIFVKGWNSAKAQQIAELQDALRMQACNYHLTVNDDELCWCRFADWTINPKCQNQRQCIAAKQALAQGR